MRFAARRPERLTFGIGARRKRAGARMDETRNAPPGPIWRPAKEIDVDAICAIDRRTHRELSERPEVHAEKIALFGEGCSILADGPSRLGYAIAYPWRLDDVPAMDVLLGALPGAPDCIFIHDVALLPEARGRGAGKAFVQRAAALARALDLQWLALVSVHGTHPLWGGMGFVVTEAFRFSEALKPYGPTARHMRRLAS